MRIPLRLALIAFALFLCVPSGHSTTLQDAPSATPDAAKAEEAARVALEKELGASLKEALGGRADSSGASVDALPKPAKDWQESVDRVMATVNGAVAYDRLNEGTTGQHTGAGTGKMLRYRRPAYGDGD